MTARQSAAPIYSTPRRRVKGVLVRCPSTDGWKTRAARLVCALKGRYSHVQGGYILSELKAARLAKLYAAGWDANSISLTLIEPKAPNGR